MQYFFKFKDQSFKLLSLLKLRERYLFTRGKKLRLRYSAMAVSSLLAVSVFMSYQANGSLSGGLPDTKDALSVAAISAQSDVVVEGQQAFVSDDVMSRISGAMRSAPAIIKKSEKVPFKRVSVGQGQTIAGVLQNAGLSNSDAYYSVKAISKHFDPRKVKSGQKLDVHFKENDEGMMEFEKLSMKISPIKEIAVAKTGEENFDVALQEQELKRKVYGRYASIQTSLYGSAARADIPSPIIAEMIRIYSWNIDFQRDIRRGDKVQVLYEAFENDDGDFAKYGKILYASLNTGGREKPVYRFEMNDGRIDYFEPDGTSVRKTLMKTPVDGARISSGFGMRRHPILGYNKMHKGMDFAAPTGTPIYAAGDGVVEESGRKGAYGNYIRVRHNSKLKTAYAHLSKFKKGVRRGTTVKQGQVIGYVGSTGRSTGPHLHYEVIVNGTQVNPRSVDLPTGEILAGNQLKRFKSLVRNVDQEYASLTKGLKFASSDGQELSRRRIH